MEVVLGCSTWKEMRASSLIFFYANRLDTFGGSDVLAEMFYGI